MNRAPIDASVLLESFRYFFDLDEDSANVTTSVVALPVDSVSLVEWILSVEDAHRVTFDVTEMEGFDGLGSLGELLDGLVASTLPELDKDGETSS